MPVRVRSSPANQCGEDVEKTDDDDTSPDCGRGGEFEFEEIEAGKAFDGGPTGDGVVAGTFARRGPAGAFGDTERNGDRRAIELVREFGAAQRQPSNDKSTELEGATVRVEPME